MEARVPSRNCCCWARPNVRVCLCSAGSHGELPGGGLSERRGPTRPAALGEAGPGGAGAGAATRRQLALAGAARRRLGALSAGAALPGTAPPGGLPARAPRRGEAGLGGARGGALGSIWGGRPPPRNDALLRRLRLGSLPFYLMVLLFMTYRLSL